MIAGTYSDVESGIKNFSNTCTVFCFDIKRQKICYFREIVRSIKLNSFYNGKTFQHYL